MKSEKTYLYRHFSDCGELLYVGISLNHLSRLHHHKLYSHWFDEIKVVKLELFETRDSAIKAEISAIKIEKPKYNLTFNNSKKIHVKKDEHQRKKMAETFWYGLYERTSKELVESVNHFYETYKVIEEFKVKKYKLVKP